MTGTEKGRSTPNSTTEDHGVSLKILFACSLSEEFRAVSVVINPMQVLFVAHKTHEKTRKESICVIGRITHACRGKADRSWQVSDQSLQKHQY